jgi:hypothetical protein
VSAFDPAYARWFALRPVVVDNMAVIGTLVYDCGHERHLWTVEWMDRRFVSGEPLTRCEDCTVGTLAAFRAEEKATLVRICPECRCFGTDDSQMHESGGWSDGERTPACPTLSDDYDFAAAADRIYAAKVPA